MPGSAWVSEYSNLGENGLSNDAFPRLSSCATTSAIASVFASRLTYYMYVLGDLDRARQTFDLNSQAYPREERPLISAGIISIVHGQYDDAIRKTLEAIRLDRDRRSPTEI